MSSFENLAAYATEDRIIRLIAKERGKYTAKNGGPSNPFKNDILFNQIRSMCPPHSLWHNPGRGKLPQESDSWTCQMDIKEEARIRAGMSGYQKIHGVNAGSGLGSKS